MEKKKLDRKQITTLSKQLPVKLTNDELLEFGQRLAKSGADLGEHEMLEAAVKQDLKAKKTAIESEQARLCGIVRAKAEVRDVRCEIWANYEQGQMETIRLDTNEIIDARDLAPHERQVDLALIDKPKNTEPDIKVP